MKKNIKMIVLMTLLLSLTSCFSEKEEPQKVNNIDIQQEVDSISDKDKKVSEKNVETVKNIQNEMSDDMKDISQKVLDGKMTEQEAKDAIFKSMNKSNTLKSQLEIQKEQMPKILKIMKANLKCIKDVDNQKEAEKCKDESNKLAKKYGIEDIFKDDKKNFKWEQDKKSETIKEIEGGIAQLENMIPCLEKAKVMTEFMECSKDFNK